MAYPVALDEWGRAPSGMITKRDRMRAAAFGFDAEGKALAVQRSTGAGLYMVAYRFVNTQTGEFSALRVYGMVAVQ